MAAFVDEILQHRTWLYHLARSLVHNQATAEDLVQETCETALRQREHTSQNIPLAPWLAGVLRNIARMHHRGELRRKRREQTYGKDTSLRPSPEHLLERVQAEHTLAEAVLALAEPYRTTILLRFFEGMSAADIARRQGIPAGTVRWRQKHALAMLRRALRDGDERQRATLSVLTAAGIPLPSAPTSSTASALTGVGGSVAVAGALLALVVALWQLGPTERVFSIDRTPSAPSPPPTGFESTEAAGLTPDTDWQAPPQYPLTRLPTTPAEEQVNAPAGPRRRTPPRHAASRSHARTTRPNAHKRHIDCARSGDCPPESMSPPRSSPTDCQSFTSSLAATHLPRRTVPMHTPITQRAWRTAMLGHLLILAQAGCLPDVGTARENTTAFLCSTDTQADGTICVQCIDASGVLSTTCDDSAAGQDGTADACESQTTASGAICITCTSDDGTATTSCTDPAVGECHSDTEDTGTTCITCVDANGSETSQCSEPGDDPQDCVVDIDVAGNVCIACLNETGTATVLCDDPVTGQQCTSETQADGTLCVNCIDAAGVVISACTGPDSTQCTTESQSDGTVCVSCFDPATGQTTTTCDGGGEQCMSETQSDGTVCTTCIDPVTGVATTTCHGTDGQCTSEIQADGTVCTTCINADGTTTTTCDQPTTGDCTTETQADGTVCTTCIDADGTVTVTCEEPLATTCTSDIQADGSVCILCTDAAVGTTTIICDTDSGIECTSESTADGAVCYTCTAANGNVTTTCG